MSTQIALALTEIGKPLTKISLPGPDTFELAANEVLIKLTATGCQSMPYAETYYLPPVNGLSHLTNNVHQWHPSIKNCVTGD